MELVASKLKASGPKNKEFSRLGLVEQSTVAVAKYSVRLMRVRTGKQADSQYIGRQPATV